MSAEQGLFVDLYVQARSSHFKDSHLWNALATVDLRDFLQGLATSTSIPEVRVASAHLESAIIAWRNAQENNSTDLDLSLLALSFSHAFREAIQSVEVKPGLLELLRVIVSRPVVDLNARLVELTQHAKEPAELTQAISIIEDVHHPSAIGFQKLEPVIEACLTSTDEGLSAIAISYLESRSCPTRLFPKLLGLLHRQSDYIVGMTRSAIRKLAPTPEVSVTSAVLLLLELDRSSDSSLKEDLLVCFGNFGEAASAFWQKVRYYTHDVDSDVRFAAYSALACIGGDAYEAVRVGLKDSDPQIQVLCAHCLARGGSEEMVEDLLEVLRRSDKPDVRHASAVAVLKLDGSDSLASQEAARFLGDWLPNGSMSIFGSYEDNVVKTLEAFISSGMIDESAMVKILTLQGSENVKVAGAAQRAVDAVR